MGWLAVKGKEGKWGGFLVFGGGGFGRVLGRRGRGSGWGIVY